MTGKPSGHAHLRQGFHLRQGYGGQDGGQAGEALLGEVVPRMTSETLAQDPAEFRRKFKGLRQLYLRSHTVYSPGRTRAGEAVSSA
jgi:hypothetical protein